MYLSEPKGKKKVTYPFGKKIKIEGDFLLIRSYDFNLPKRHIYTLVQTRWYRPREFILTETHFPSKPWESDEQVLKQ